MDSSRCCHKEVTKPYRQQRTEQEAASILVAALHQWVSEQRHSIWPGLHGVVAPYSHDNCLNLSGTVLPSVRTGDNGTELEVTLCFTKLPHVVPPQQMTFNVT